MDAMYTGTMEQEDQDEAMPGEELRDDEDEMVDRMEVFLPVVQSLVNALGGYEVSVSAELPLNIVIENMTICRISSTQKPKLYRRHIFRVTLVWLFYVTSRSYGERTTPTTSERCFDVFTAVTLPGN